MRRRTTKQNISCLVCKLACHSNQNLVICKICNLHAHLGCSKVGMNFGRNNFVCAGCHQKTGYLSGLLKSTAPCQESTRIDDRKTPSNGIKSFASNSHMYHSVEDVNNNVLQTKQAGDLFIIHINASSLPKHFDTIASLCIDKFTCHPDIICITESRLKDKKKGKKVDLDYQLKLIGLENYKLILRQLPNKRWGCCGLC